MLDLLTASGFSYLLIAAFVAGDGVIPIVPGEIALISGGVLVSDGELSLPLVILAGIVGGFAGDNISYLLGNRLGPLAADRFFRSERSRERLGWARTMLRERGAQIILTARFIPGGRTATTFAAGALAMPWRRFAPVDLVAVCAWSFYAVLIGSLAGNLFVDNVWAPLLATIALATLIGFTLEMVRRTLVRRRAA